jgi:predicted phage-related endonuclease
MPDVMAVSQMNVPVLERDEAGFHAYLMNGRDHRGQPISLGGTDVGAICGVNRYKTPADVWDAIMGLAPERADSGGMRRGRALEPLIVDEYMDETGRLTRETEPLYRLDAALLLRHRASPDRFVWKREHAMVGSDAHRGVLEVKSMNERVFRDAKLNGIDPSYYAQLQHYLSVCGCTWGSFACLHPDSWELHWFDVERDEAFCAAMYARVRTFWHEHVLPRRRPASDANVSDRPMPAVSPRVLGAEAVTTSDPEVMRLATQLKAAKENADLFKRQFEGLKEQMQNVLVRLDTSVLVVPGVGRISWKESTSRTFNREALAEAHPTLDLTPFYRVTATRTFTVR